MSLIFVFECNYRILPYFDMLQSRMNTGIVKDRRQKSTVFLMVPVVGFESTASWPRNGNQKFF